MMREHGSLAAALDDLRAKQAQRESEIEQGKMKLSKGLGKIDVPPDWPWEEAKELFLKPEVVESGDIEVSIRITLPRFGTSYADVAVLLVTAHLECSR
jgi:hypothetical protein